MKRLGDIDPRMLRDALMAEADEASQRSRPGDAMFPFDHTAARVLFALAKAIRTASDNTNA